MDTKWKQGKRTIRYCWILISLVLLFGCSPSSSLPRPLTATPIIVPSQVVETFAQTPTQRSGSWRVVGIYNADHSIMTGGFLDELHVVTGGVVGQMGYSSDGAETWLVTDALADCRYGMDIVSPDVIWTCGGATHVRRSIDGGKTWQALAAFGDPRTITTPCHSASFLDENTGWLANWSLFGTTVDSGASWTMQPLPETADKIATIDTYGSGDGYLLDQRGALFFTDDDGAHWREVTQLELDTLKIPFSAYQMAAMRFSDAEHGLIVVSSSPYGKPESVLAFHTSDGGKTWTSETVPVLAGPVYLAREGSFLTVITGVNQLTLLQYAG